MHSTFRYLYPPIQTVPEGPRSDTGCLFSEIDFKNIDHISYFTKDIEDGQSMQFCLTLKFYTRKEIFRFFNREVMLSYAEIAFKRSGLCEMSEVLQFPRTQLK
jgi:hypothetical protein